MAMPQLDRSYEAELRCPGTLHGIRKGDLIESKCHHIRCTKGRVGVAVFHYFDPQTGELVDTKEYQDPVRRFRNGST